MATIDALMKTKLILAGPSDTIRRAAELMDQNGVGAVLVVEGNEKDGRLLGFFSERDLLHRVVAAGLDPQTTTIDSVMTREPTSVEPGTHVRDGAKLIRDRGVRHLPVVRDGKPIGILSARDLQAFMVEGLEAFIDQAKYKEALEEGRDPYDHMGGSYAR